MTRIIAVTGSKGGVSKATVTLLLAWEFSRRGFSVEVIDADVQGSSISAKVLDPDSPFRVEKAKDRRELWEQSKQFSDDGTDFVIVDTNPRSSAEPIPAPLVPVALPTSSPKRPLAGRKTDQIKCTLDHEDKEFLTNLAIRLTNEKGELVSVSEALRHLIQRARKRDI